MDKEFLVKIARFTSDLHDPFTTKINVSNINNIGHKFLIVLALRIWFKRIPM